MSATLDYEIKKEGLPEQANLFYPVSRKTLVGELAVPKRTGEPYTAFLEQFLEPPVANNYPAGKPEMCIVPTWCTWKFVPIIDDADILK